MIGYQIQYSCRQQPWCWPVPDMKRISKSTLRRWLHWWHHVGYPGECICNYFLNRWSYRRHLQTVSPGHEQCTSESHREYFHHSNRLHHTSLLRERDYNLETRDRKPEFSSALQAKEQAVGSCSGQGFSYRCRSLCCHPSTYHWQLLSMSIQHWKRKKGTPLHPRTHSSTNLKRSSWICWHIDYRIIYQIYKCKQHVTARVNIHFPKRLQA